MIFRLTTISLAAFNLVAPAVFAAEGTYDYDHPELWQDMEDSECAGMKNSPIALTSSDCTAYGEYEMWEGDCTFSDMEFMVTNNGVNMIYADSATCQPPYFTIPVESIPGVYTNANVHIHLSSEHTVDDGFYPAEMHMVHLNEDGSRAAVLGTMIDVGAPFNHPIFEKYLQAWESARAEVECGTCAVSDGSIDAGYRTTPYDMLESDDYYHYDGGLTTPPCSEIVWWNFNADSMVISSDQYARLTDIILNTHIEVDGECTRYTVASEGGSTSRPVQPLNGRVVEKICNRATKKTAKAVKSTKVGKAEKGMKVVKDMKAKKATRAL